MLTRTVWYTLGVEDGWENRAKAADPHQSLSVKCWIDWICALAESLHFGGDRTGEDKSGDSTGQSQGLLGAHKHRGGGILVFTQQQEVQDDLQRFRDVSSLAASQESYLRYTAADRDPTLFLMRWTSASWQATVLEQATWDKLRQKRKHMLTVSGGFAGTSWRPP